MSIVPGIMTSDKVDEDDAEGPDVVGAGAVGDTFDVDAALTFCGEWTLTCDSLE